MPLILCGFLRPFAADSLGDLEGDDGASFPRRFRSQKIFKISETAMSICPPNAGASHKPSQPSCNLQPTVPLLPATEATASGPMDEAVWSC